MSANIYFVIGGMYMSVQSEFIGFHERIKLDYDVRSELASKRDILIDKLRRSGKLPGFTRVLNTYVISKFYRILYLSQSRLIFLSNFEICLLYGDVRC
jgi:hypothetical protein